MHEFKNFPKICLLNFLQNHMRQSLKMGASWECTRLDHRVRCAVFKKSYYRLMQTISMNEKNASQTSNVGFQQETDCWLVTLQLR